MIYTTFLQKHHLVTTENTDLRYAASGVIFREISEYTWNKILLSFFSFQFMRCIPHFPSHHFHVSQSPRTFNLLSLLTAAYSPISCVVGPDIWHKRVWSTGISLSRPELKKNVFVCFQI